MMRVADCWTDEKLPDRSAVCVHCGSKRIIAVRISSLA